MSPTQHLLQVDPVLAQLIPTTTPFAFESTQNVFHDLVGCIIEQQIHYRSKRNLYSKRLERADIELLTPDLFDQFEEKGLADLKLSMRKQETLLQVVDYFKQHTLDWQQLTDADVRAYLSAIKGIGKWTQDMILLFTLEHPDVFPYDDFRLKQVMTELYNLNPASRLKAQMLDCAQPWQPYASQAVLYLMGK
ncbi:MAG: hypothetical protein AAGI23_04020 [Bacteroidota bacterium]